MSQPTWTLRSVLFTLRHPLIARRHLRAITAPVPW